MFHILFLIPYYAVGNNINQVFREAISLREEEITYDIRVAKTEEVLKIGSAEADVVICRGYTSALLQTMLPKIELQVSAFDMMKAVRECVRKYDSRKIAFVGTTGIVYGAGSLNEVMDDVELMEVCVPSIPELDRELERLMSVGVDGLIGGRTLGEHALVKGMNYVLLESGKESVYQAVEEAITALKFSRKEKERSEYLQTLMDYSFEGILSADMNGKILSANRFATEKLGKISTHQSSGGEILGEKVERYFPGLRFDADSGKTLAKLISSGHCKYMVNCVPLAGKEEIEGWIITFRDVETIQADESRIRRQMHRKGLFAKYHFEHVIGNSQKITDVIRVAKKYACAESNIFIHGETGTGKELFAQSIHNASRRREGPFVAINCAALPQSLLESELFGYVEGAFTGASRGGKAGLFELAHNGTLFLDEIGDMDINLQARLLRVIQEREIMRLGGSEVIPVDVRIIAASNRDMSEAVRDGHFRQDLLYRIDVLRLALPPLRDRGHDVLELAKYYIEREHLKSGCTLQGLNKAAQEWILAQPWDGNVRELRNFCERLCVLCEKEHADMTDIEAASGNISRNTVEKVGNAEREKERIEMTLKEHGYSRKESAAALHMDTSTLWRKMKKYGIKRA